MSEFNSIRTALPHYDRWGELYPFESHYLNLSGSRYHYLDESPTNNTSSNLPTLLFVHGNPTWSFHWRRLILAHSEHYRCVAPDHLGCGLSGLQHQPQTLADHIDNLVQLVEGLNLERITLVAQDWGGAIGLGALLKASDRFERVALFNTGAFPPWFIPWRIRVCRWPILGQMALKGANGFSRAALRLTLARSKRLDARVAEAYLAPYHSWQRRHAVHQFVKDIPLSARHPTWKTLQQIEEGLPGLYHLPIQLIWGMKDWCFTPECLDKSCEHWPHAEVQKLENVGHWVVEDAPEVAESLFGVWLTRTSPTRLEVHS